MESHEHKKSTEAHKSHHTHKSKSKAKPKGNRLLVGLVIVLVLFGLYNLFQASSFDTLIDERVADAKEASKPAKIKLLAITTDDCEDCYDISAVIDTINSTGVNLTSINEVDASSNEAKQIVSKLGIEKLPTVVLTGELNRSPLASALRDKIDEKQGAYIFTALEPPFVETSTGEVRGRISLVHLQKRGCDECSDFTPLISQLSEAGLVFASQRDVYIDTAEGRSIVSKYNISKVPAIIMDKEADVYPNIVQGWTQQGSIEEDGSYVTRIVSPPYYDVEEGRLKGLISVTFLVDESCDECYAPETFHKPILARLGMAISGEERIDVSSAEGKEIVEGYGIEKVPVLILEGDMEEYPALVSAWPPVGTVESDGAYVFRKVELARQKYKDLIIGEVVDPSSGAAPGEGA